MLFFRLKFINITIVEKLGKIGDLQFLNFIVTASLVSNIINRAEQKVDIPRIIKLASTAKKRRTEIIIGPTV